MTSEPLGTYDTRPIQDYLKEHFPNKEPAWADPLGASKDSPAKAKFQFYGFTLEIPLQFQRLWRLFRYGLLRYDSKLTYAYVRSLVRLVQSK